MTPIETANAVLTAWEQRDSNRMGSLLATDFVLTGPAPVPLNKQAFLVFQQVHNDAFADWQFNPHVLEDAMAAFGSAFRSRPHTPARMMSASSVCHSLRFQRLASAGSGHRRF